ncbi:Translational activator GCN1 [Smittium mucronatum]|uniref:Translational activator GCN1 n=1 Tax=Smittium mucronatum TaxID=133383 RepID=A0A1R0GYD0_9FUNG|nr:Translational activator GCN1 [Smittium mucronatum]
MAEYDNEELSLLPWPEYLQKAVVPTINSNKLPHRVSFFNTDFINKLAKNPIPEKAVVSVVRTLHPALLKYSDRDSRLAILSSLKAIGIANPVPFFESILLVLSSEIDKIQPKTITNLELIPGARGYRFSHLIWINLALDFLFKQSISEPEKYSKTALRLIDYQSRLLWGLGPLSDPSNSDSRTKTIFHSALSDTRRLIRNNKTFIPFYLATLTDSSFSKLVYSNVLLGNVLSTLIRLKDADIGVDLIIQPIFFSISANYQQNVAKATREPTIYSEKLATIIIKSTNQQVINKCVSLFTTLSQKCLSFDNITASAESLLSVLGKNKTASLDSKILLIDLLKKFSEGSSNRSKSSDGICRLILKSISNETHEQTLVSYLDTLGHHFKIVISSNLNENDFSNVIEEVLSKCLEGIKLSGRMLGVRKAWIVFVVAYPVLNLSSKEYYSYLFSYFEKLTQELFKIAEKIQSNSNNSGYEPIEGYSILVSLLSFFNQISEDKQRYLVDQIISSRAELSFLFNRKVYNKVSSDNEFYWLTNAVQASFSVTKDLISMNKFSDFKLGFNVNTFKPLLWAFENSSTTISKKMIFESLNQMANTSILPFLDFLSIDLVASMNSYFFSSLFKAKNDESDLSLSSGDWYNLLVSSIPNPSEDSPSFPINEYLASLILPAHHPVITFSGFDKYTFPSLLLHSGVDIRSLCLKKLDQFINLVSTSLVDYGVNHPMGMASMSIVKSLSLILEDTFFRAAFDCSSSLSKLSCVESITDEDMVIWNTPESDLAFDPLQIKSNNDSKVGGKDGWENEIKNDVNRKRLESRRLTKEEQNLVDTQKSIENDVRSRISNSYNHLLGALVILSSCVDGNLEVSRNNSTELLHVALDKILSSKGATRLLGSKAGFYVMNIFKMASGLNSSLHDSLAIATLRSREFDDACPEKWLKEPIENLISRVLFKIRLALDFGFEAADFSIVFPILSATIIRGGWGVKSDSPTRIDEVDEYTVLDQPTEQLLMSTEIILLNSDKASSDSFPRVDYLKLSLFIMSNYNDLFSKARDSLVEASNVLDGIENLIPERRIILSGLLEKDSLIRYTCLESLLNFSFEDLSGEPSLELIGDLSLLWITIFDNDATNSELARKIWDEYNLSASPEIVKYIVDPSSGLLSHKVLAARENSSKAIFYCILELNSFESIDDQFQHSEESNTHHLTDTSMKLFEFACSELMKRYSEWYISLDVEYDQYGIAIPGTNNKIDPFEARVSVAWALKCLSPLMYSDKQVQNVINFLLDSEALGDRNEEVREAMLETGVEIISKHGHIDLEGLSTVFENWLANPNYTSESHDRMRESVIVLLGTLAGHLKSGDPRIPSVLRNLVASLHTPSESVQSAISSCLIILSKKLDSDELDKLVKHLLIELFNGKKYAIRRGAAYGLAGVVKGYGLSSLRRFNIIEKIKKSASDKKSANARQGSLFALETLTSFLGRIFEPYMIQALPIMLNLFGDPNSDVRDAASETSNMIMSKLSGYGVKLMLPSLLSGLKSDQWRIKKGSIEMIGSMAYCAPKQLSVALPSVVPHLVENLSDSHMEVSEAARKALKSFGSVIHNPEISVLVPVLLSALTDPTRKTDVALVHLLETSFVHYIDAPSLALIAPVLERGMKERKTTIKRHAAQVFGSMALLSEPSDLVMYIPKMLPLLKSILSDPLPETRGTSAKALGQLVSRLGEGRFEKIVEELLEEIQNSPVAIDRAGSAQALSEILYGIGIERLEILMPRIIRGCEDESPKVRDGYMLLVLYLPSTFNEQFIIYLNKIISPILKSLADENEMLRNTALRVSQTLVAFYFSTASDNLVDGFLTGLKSENWRIRRASVELLGDLLLRIAGKSSKPQDLDDNNDSDGSGDEEDHYKKNDDDGNESDDDEDNELSVEGIRLTLGEVLGEEKRDYVIAAIYISRNDIVNSVRQASMLVWKTLTSNTPRTVKECLEPLVTLVLEGLSSSIEEQRSTSALTLGDMVRKLGDTVIKRVIPILEGNLYKDNVSESSRQGVFIGLSEILSCSSSTHVEEYGNAITPLVRIGLCDSDPLVRESAANAFDSLQNVLGSRVLDNILPYLLNSLSNENKDITSISNGSSNVSADSALKGLQELMSIRSNLLLPTLIPTLIVEPISEFHAQALESLIKIAGVSSPALVRRLTPIISGLFSSIYIHQKSSDISAQSACRKAISGIVSMSYKDEAAMDLVMGLLFDTVRGSEILNDSKSRDLESRRSRRIEGCYALGSIYQVPSPGTSSTIGHGIGKYTGEWISILVGMFSIDDNEIIESVHRALSFVIKSIPKLETTKFISVANKAVLSASKNSSSRKDKIPGFNVPKGITSLLSLYTHGLLEGSDEVKKISVLSISNLVQFTENDYLKPSITAITGPLIRIVGDRISPDVRSVVIQALGSLLQTVPQYLKPFLPQLQRTFVKYLSDNDQYIRTQSQDALSVLIPLQPRLDPLVSELTSGIKSLYQSILSSTSNPSDTQFESCACMIRALTSALKSESVKTLSETSFKSIEACLIGHDALSIGNRQVQSALADALPEFLKSTTLVSRSVGIESVIRTAIAKTGESSDSVEGKMRVAISLLQGTPEVILGPDSPVGPENLVKSIFVALGSNDLQTVMLGIRTSLLAFQNKMFYEEKNSSSRNDTQSHSECENVSFPETLLTRLVEFVDPSSENTNFIDSDIKQSVFVTFKTIYKSGLEFCEDTIYKLKHRFYIAQSAFSYVRSRQIPLKLSAERCIIYALNLANMGVYSFKNAEPSVNTEMLNEYIKSVGGPESEHGKIASDYYRRVLSKIALKTYDENYTSDTDGFD